MYFFWAKQLRSEELNLIKVEELFRKLEVSKLMKADYKLKNGMYSLKLSIAYNQAFLTAYPK